MDIFVESIIEANGCIKREGNSEITLESKIWAQTDALSGTTQDDIKNVLTIDEMLLKFI